MTRENRSSEMHIDDLQHILAMALFQLTNNVPEDDGFVPVPALGSFLEVEGLHLDPHGIERKLIHKILKAIRRSKNHESQNRRQSF